MPNARPTQPGYYWARPYGSEQWEPCDLYEYKGRQEAFLTGDERGHNPDHVEWGPAIPEYRGEGGG